MRASTIVPLWLVLSALLARIPGGKELRSAEYRDGTWVVRTAGGDIEIALRPRFATVAITNAGGEVSYPTNTVAQAWGRPIAAEELVWAP